MKPAMTPQQAKFSDSSKSPLALYREYAVGNSSLPFFVYYELLTLIISGLPGLLGFGARALFYPSLFKSCGRRPAIGRGVVIRTPGQISLGKKNLIDDYAVLDVRGSDASITTGDHCSIGRFTTIAAKGGHITLGDGVNIGSYCRIATQSRVTIEDSTLVAAYAYIGPGNHQEGDGETPLIARDMDIRGGVKIGSNAWIGSGAIILDGVSIGSGAIIGAHSLVKENVPQNSVAVGVPAKIVRSVKAA
jgi:acetyltransferase-like isoleucine patch superfamily enzyme